MACCTCCCEAVNGECCGTTTKVCCKDPRVCCNNVCCVTGEYCCGTTCCPEDNVCCDEVCCEADETCCDGVCCPDGYNCCEGVCQEDACECVADGDCCYCVIATSATAYACEPTCPEGFTKVESAPSEWFCLKTERDACDAECSGAGVSYTVSTTCGSFTTTSDAYNDGGYCCDGACSYEECPP